MVLEMNGGETGSKKMVATSNTVCSAGKLISGDLVFDCSKMIKSGTSGKKKLKAGSSHPQIIHQEASC